MEGGGDVHGHDLPDFEILPMSCTHRQVFVEHHMGGGTGACFLLIGAVEVGSVQGILLVKFARVCGPAGLQPRSLGV